uniref:Ovule protein n=1 Tax=Romanomermis culicivorax TaxID=13658 RepID=A0A915J1Q0_ROMCU
MTDITLNLPCTLHLHLFSFVNGRIKLMISVQSWSILQPIVIDNFHIKGCHLCDSDLFKRAPSMWKILNEFI